LKSCPAIQSTKRGAFSLLFVPYVTGGLKELLFSEIIFPSKFALDNFF